MTSNAHRQSKAIPRSLGGAGATVQPQSQSLVKPSPSTPGQRLKLVVRRLPPELSESSFLNALGEEWSTRQSKVVWLSFRPGKASKHLSKIPRTSRAYVQLSNASLVRPFSEKLQSIDFSHAGTGARQQTSSMEPCSVEVAPFGKVPSGKIRRDARQGTIDQDPEFIDFLESLTSPTPRTKPFNQDQENDSRIESISTTPLIQFLKDKKASKVKDVPNQSKAGSKALNDERAKEVSTQTKPGPRTGKDEPTKDSKQVNPISDVHVPIVETKSKTSAPATNTSSNKTTLNDKIKIAKKAPDTKPKGSADVEIGGRKQNNIVSNAQADPKKPKAIVSEQRPRGSASVAAQILQRDLGIGETRRARKSSRNNSATASNTEAGKAQQIDHQDTPKVPPTAEPPTSKTVPTTPSTDATTNASPRTTKVVSSADVQGNSKNKANASSATQAFIKNANPALGVTEPQLHNVFGTFGNVVKVEMDKKKNFAYLTFSDAESLQKAIKARTVHVGQAVTQVLERRIPSQSASSQASENKPSAKNIGKSGKKTFQGDQSIPSPSQQKAADQKNTHLSAKSSNQDIVGKSTPQKSPAAPADQENKAVATEASSAVPKSVTKPHGGKGASRGTTYRGRGGRANDGNVRRKSPAPPRPDLQPSTNSATMTPTESKSPIAGPRTSKPPLKNKPGKPG